jgi:hypothetical protein
MNFDDRRVNINDDTHLTKECISCKVPQKGRDFVSLKLALKSGLRYKVAVGIVMGEMKWINGPFNCRKYPDVKKIPCLLIDLSG